MSDYPTIMIPDTINEGPRKTPHGQNVHVYGGYDEKSRSYGFDLDTGATIRNPDFEVYATYADQNPE